MTTYISLKDVIDIADKAVTDGFTSVVLGLLSNRDLSLGDDIRDEDRPAAREIAQRLSTHTKVETIWDSGDGRDGIHVVCFDEMPIAIVHEEGYDTYNYAVVVLDLARLDLLCAAVHTLTPKVMPLEQAELDSELPHSFRVVKDEAEPASAPRI